MNAPRANFGSRREFHKSVSAAPPLAQPRHALASLRLQPAPAAAALETLQVRAVLGKAAPEHEGAFAAHARRFAVIVRRPSLGFLGSRGKNSSLMLVLDNCSTAARLNRLAAPGCGPARVAEILPTAMSRLSWYAQGPFCPYFFSGFQPNDRADSRPRFRKVGTLGNARVLSQTLPTAQTRTSTFQLSALQEGREAIEQTLHSLKWGCCSVIIAALPLPAAASAAFASPPSTQRPAYCRRPSGGAVGPASPKFGAAC